MLTHDVEPIIDTVKSLSRQFNNQVAAAFLKMKAGIIQEENIVRDDLKTFSAICKSFLGSNKDEVIKLIYLRRYLEISDGRGDAYQVISNILHNRERAIDTREPNTINGSPPEMKPSEFSNGCKDVEEHLPGFSYDAALLRLNNDGALKSLYSKLVNGYEKLQVFRLLKLEPSNPVIHKFVNETYHIENEFIYQLDPAKFDIVPEYVISECDRILSENP